MRPIQFCGRVTRLALAVAILVALLCPGPSLVLGQSSDRPKSSRDPWEARVRPSGENIFYNSVLDRSSGLSLELGQPLRPVLLQSRRAATGSYRTGSPSPSTKSSELSDAVPAVITNDTFTNGAGTGLWSNGGNWSAGVPTSSNNVLITGTGAAAKVIEDVSSTINNMTLKSSNTWSLNNGIELTLDGNSISNAGSMLMNSSGNFTGLQIGSPFVTLSGAGTLTMSNNVNNFIFGTVAADTLINQETIQGAGNIGFNRMTLVNSGTINANQSAGLTIETNGGTVNTGTIKATAGGLTLSGTTVINTGGTISTSGPTLLVSSSTINGGTVTLTGTSTLQLSNGTVQNGTLTNSSKGTIEVLSFTTSNTLGGTITNPAGGVIKIDNGAVLSLQGGSYPTLGTVTLNSTGNATDLQVLGGNVTLSAGNLTMSNNAENVIFGSVTTDTLTNQETIQGAGNIGANRMTLVNSGTINANQSNGIVIQANGGTTNSGTMEATAGNLTFMGTVVNNSGGTISASGGNALLVSGSIINGGTVTLTGASTLQLSNGAVQSGTLNNSATGTIEILSFTTSNTLGGTISNPAGGVIKIDNGATLNLEGGSYPNLGAVALNSTGNSTALQVLGNNTTLSGGSVTLSNSAENFIVGLITQDTLTNKETIQGAGNIGGGRMTLVNSGTINANQSAGLTIQVNGGVVNTGTLEGTIGNLTFTSTVVANSGGTISASGGNALQLNNSTINGGTVALTGASSLKLNGGTVQGGTLNNSATGTIEALSFTTDTLGGTITNPAGGVVKIDNGATVNLEGGTYNQLGAVTLNSTGNNTVLQLFGANTTLSGGSVTMSNAAQNFIVGSTSTDTLTNKETILGAGNIGGNRMTLVNSGTINANQAAGLTIQANGGAVNSGTITATAGTLTFNGTVVANTGTISASANTLLLTNSIINGGTVKLTGASTLQLNTGTVQNGTLTNSSTGTIEALSFTTNTLGGTITNPAGGVVKIDNGAILDLEGGTYTNLGAVQLNSTGNNTELVVFGANTTLSGGSVTMSNAAQNFIFGSTTTDTLTNKETIQGAGNIGNGQMTLVNSGTINANQSVGLTIAANGGVTNTGTIKATAGTLAFSRTTVNNTGTISVSGGNALQLASSTINGGTVTLTGASSMLLNQSAVLSGTLNNSSTGTIEAASFTTNTLGGTVNNPAGGLIKIDNGATLNLGSGTYTNGGSIQVNSTGNNTELIVNAGNVTLAGSGNVTLSNNTNNFILGQLPADILTNQGTIQGAGNIGNGGLGLVNSGTILANQSTPLLIQTSSSGITNNGTLQVASGTTMHVSGGPFTNYAGGILTGGTYNTAGTLEIDELGNTGGEVVTNAANIILNGASSSFVDAAGLDALTNVNANSTAGSGFTVTGGRSFTTAGNFTNKGTLTVGSATSKFIVNGKLTNFSGTTLTGGTYNVTGTLQFNGANIVTNAANIKLNGASATIIDQTSKNGLRGFATNSSTGQFTVTGGQTFSDGVAAFSNAGTLTAGKSSSFNLTGSTATYKQTAGTTTVDGTLTAKGGITFSGGSVFGNGGTLVGNTTNSTSTGAFNVGDAAMTAGAESITGKYTQMPTGVLDIDIGGTTAGTQFDQLTISSAASLNGTLNLDLINSFVPTVGETFDILNASSLGSSMFATVNGEAINSTEHFTVMYNSNNVTLGVASGAAAPGGFPRTGPSSATTPEPSTLLLLGGGLLVIARYARRKPAGKRGGRSGANA